MQYSLAIQTLLFNLIGKKSLYKVNTLRADNSHVSSNANKFMVLIYYLELLLTVT